MYTLDDFYIGQRVRIRSWEDMFNEFGGFHDWIIETPGAAFVGQMAHLCEKTAEIIAFDLNESDRGAVKVFLGNWEDENGIASTIEELAGINFEWIFSTSMLIPEEVGINFSFDCEAFNRMLGV